MNEGYLPYNYFPSCSYVLLYVRVVTNTVLATRSTTLATVVVVVD